MTKTSIPSRAGVAPTDDVRLSVAQVAARVDYHPATIYRMIEAGELPAVRIRGRLRVLSSAVDAAFAPQAVG